MIYCPQTYFLGLICTTQIPHSISQPQVRGSIHDLDDLDDSEDLDRDLSDL